MIPRSAELSVGYQQTTFGFGGNFIANELYVDLNNLSPEYKNIFSEYKTQFQQAIDENWQEKGMPTNSGSGPCFSQEAYNRFIKINIDFYKKGKHSVIHMSNL